MDAIVRWIVQEDGVEGDRVKERQHGLRRVGEEICEDGSGIGQVNVRDFERLGVDCKNKLDLLYRTKRTRLLRDA